ncbi:DNA repair protein [Micromonospora sp. DR5-3]|uniref:DNA repair protein n=1 Tax=unclassified Micromonospora TaxID=2617518 RepID=UPI0011D70A43|nr:MULTISPECIES: DNA repair protein [unclassified Micromonospora]MCW3815440.1 DNA repair protein [Micromonospora sp. DR5-3]TYC24254.1 DNA repair protein [Micromonospora sp. MP36]
MPNQPNDRYQQDTERSWPADGPAGQFPAQPAYREARSGGRLSWAQLNALPAGASTRHGLNTR